MTGCYAHLRYLAARGVPGRLAELAAHDCIVVGDAGKTWRFRERRSEVAIDVNARTRVNDYRIAGRARGVGAGIARLARFYASGRVAAGARASLYPCSRPSGRTSRCSPSTPRSAPTKIRAFVDPARQAAARVLDH